MNPGGIQQTALLDVTDERASFNTASFFAGRSPTALPVEFELLPSGYGYIKVNSFFDNDVLSILVWERAIKFFNDNQIPGVILDMRVNSGGSGWLADQMAAYFFEEETVVGNTARYNKGSGEFYMDPGDETLMIPPRAELRYLGPVAVLVGQACASACEFFSYNMSINDRATFVGQYPTEGAGGSVEDFLMPEDITVQITIGRAVDAQGKIHLEGMGVAPTVRVPVTFETLHRQANGLDVVLEAAQDFLRQPTAAGVIPSGAPKVGSAQDAESALASGARYLEELAAESHDASAFAQPGFIAYTVQLKDAEPVIWAYGWCSKDAVTLAANFESIRLKYVLDGEEVSADSFNTFETQSGGSLCRLSYTSLTDWPTGEHHLSTTATFTEAISDGSADYEPGDYVLDYTVYVNP